mgnify:FL=1
MYALLPNIVCGLETAFPFTKHFRKSKLYGKKALYTSIKKTFLVACAEAYEGDCRSHSLQSVLQLVTEMKTSKSESLL